MAHIEQNSSSMEKMLASTHPLEGSGQEKTMKSFVKFLKTEFTKKDWDMIISGGSISNNLEQLIPIVPTNKRKDIMIELDQYRNSFKDIEQSLFMTKIRKEVSALENEISNLKRFLKYFMITQNRKVKQLFDDEHSVDIYSVYVPITIIKGTPRPIDIKDETTYNEIAFLRKIAKKEVEIVPVDFEEDLSMYDPSRPEVWCILGNPGSGKSFLCQITALKFGMGRLPQFHYTLSISCRNPDWHLMEQKRADAKKTIDGEFIEGWLRLSMPVGPSWTTELAKHILETDGEGLLLILDGLDEFSKEIAFQNTLLFLLLTRNCLTLSTILLTSRLGAYTSISNSHTLKIDSFYQALGFSPENRDLYFRKQLTEDGKLDQFKRIIFFHEEIDQLSLIPVNASLFADLIRRSDNISAFTLTQFYMELVTYLICRQLSRMGYNEMAKRRSLFQLHPSVLDCLYRIGELAYLGISSRQLVNNRDILIHIGKEEQPCQCLGLAEEHVKKDKLGGIIRVWTFTHLTVQEFVGAFWLWMSSTSDQWLSTRYIANTDTDFSMFKMLIRFFCGLLSDQANDIQSILYRNYLKHPIPMHMAVLSKLHLNSSMVRMLGWEDFTEKYVALSEILFESHTDAFSNTLPIRKFVPRKLYFYFGKSPSPNEWNCFIRTLRLFNWIDLILVSSRLITLCQFKSLLNHSTSCPIDYLVVRLYGENFSTLSNYCDAIRKSQLPPNTKICLELCHCDLTNSETSTPFSTSLFKPFQALSLHCNEFSPQLLQQIADQLVSTDSFCFNQNRESDYEIIFPRLNSATHLTSLHLRDIPSEFQYHLRNLLPQLSNLQELTLDTNEYTYCLIPYLVNLSNLQYLDLRSSGQPKKSPNEFHIIQLLNANCHSLRVLMLSHLHILGLTRLDGLLLTLSSCTNLVQLCLSDLELRVDDVTLWSSLMNRLQCLLLLELNSVRLSDSETLSLCRGLLFHPTIRSLRLLSCGLSSNSCKILSLLIPTLRYLNELYLYHNSLSEPDPSCIKTLQEVADIYSVCISCE